jgi:2-haloacid dehalogenase
MNEIKNIIFDFGTVLLDWNPKRLFTPYFGDEAKCDWFLENVCNRAWNDQMDKGKPVAVGTEEKVAEFPEWEKEIRMYFDRWIEMIGDETPGMFELENELKAAGYGIYGLTNWNNETFCQVRGKRVFQVLDGMIVSAEEKLLKPEPEIYECLLERYGLKREECVFIDDVPKNVAGAEAVGIRAILFENPSQVRRALAALGVKVRTEE